MEIDITYCSKNERQRALRQLIVDHCRQRGIATRFVDRFEPVEIPQIIIDGMRAADIPLRTDRSKAALLSLPQEITELIDQCAWSL